MGVSAVELADDWPWLLLLLPAAYYLVLPPVAGLKLRLPARPVMNPLDLGAVDSTVRAFLVSRAEILGECGFGEAAYLHLPDAAPGADSYYALLVNRAAGETALAHLSVGRGAAPFRVSGVECFSAFPGPGPAGEGAERGARFNTTSSDVLPPFPPEPGRVRTQVPNVRGEAELVRLHRFVVARHAPPGEPRVYPAGGEAEYLAEEAHARHYRRMAERGWLRLNRAGDAYRPTVWGAYRLVWGQMPPAKGLRVRAMRRREARVLAEFRRAERKAGY